MGLQYECIGRRSLDLFLFLNVNVFILARDKIFKNDIFIDL